MSGKMIDFESYKVRRVPGFKDLYQIVLYGLIDGEEVLPGYFETVRGAQEYADALNTMRKEVALHV